MSSREVSQREYLGHIISPTGTIIITDFGYLHLWCHDRQPTIPEYLSDAPEEVIELLNKAVDLKIVGPDAREAGRLFDRNWHPEYLYDVPRVDLEKVEQLFNDCLQNHNLNAALEVLNSRITHRERVELALQDGNGAGEIRYHGIWAVVVGNLPQNQRLSVYGERMADKEWNDYWRWIILEVQPEGQVVTSRELGRVFVDYARLIFTDVEALAQWVHNDPLDGKADFAFWGRDGAVLAEKVEANTLAEGTFGWKDLPLEQAIKKGRETHQVCHQLGLKVALDFRPHSHPHLLLEQIRSSETESGTLELNGAILCGFMTSWGDGIFPVLGEFDHNNQPVRIRIDLGNEKTLERMEKMLAQ